MFFWKLLNVVNNFCSLDHQTLIWMQRACNCYGKGYWSISKTWEYFWKTCFSKTYATFSLQSDVCKALNRNYRMNKLTNYCGDILRWLITMSISWVMTIRGGNQTSTFLCSYLLFDTASFSHHMTCCHCNIILAYFHFN